jgi:two-component system sensor kinase FixL
MIAAGRGFANQEGLAISVKHGSSGERGRIGHLARLVFAVLVAALIFWIDTFTTLSSAVAVLYVIVILLVGEGPPGRVIVVSAVCLVLTTASLVLGHGWVPALAPFLRFVFSAAANLVTTLLVLQNARAREVLRLSEERYRTIYNTLAVAIWEHDLRPVKAALEALRALGITDIRRYVAEHPEFVRGARASVRITDANDTALQMMGVPTREAFFTRLDQFLPEDDTAFAQCIIAIDEGHPRFESEAVIRTADGSELRIIVALTFPPGGEGLDRIQGSITDITERARIQGMLDQTRSELDGALRAATIGAASASIAHELNQPLSAMTISGAASCSVSVAAWLASSPCSSRAASATIASIGTAACSGAVLPYRPRTRRTTSRARCAALAASCSASRASPISGGSRSIQRRAASA